jgi:hypothetical protein
MPIEGYIVFMKRIIVIFISSLIGCSVLAGDISIEKSDSLIRNDLFDEKRVRAEEYKQYESERKVNNHYWISQIDPSCGLLRDRYLIYFCAANSRYYKGYESGNGLQYRQLSDFEVKKIANEND